MEECANVWNVRFELTTGGFTFSRVSCKHEELSKGEVRDWAQTQLRANPRYLRIDDIYPVDDDNEPS